MKFHSMKIFALAALLPFVASAQDRFIGPPDGGGIDAAQAGEYEFSLGGNGVSNQDFDNSAGGVGASLGYYLTDQLEVLLRQSITYSNPSPGGTVWNGSTRGALDLHFTSPWAPVRPFVGVNLGGVYGDAVEDTWAAGLEAGAKFYVQPKTFIYVMGEYSWFFEEATEADNRFNDGQYLWSVGLGYNF